MGRDKLIDYMRSRGDEPPKMVLEADKNDVFAWGFSETRRGFANQAIHKIGEMRDGHFHHIEPEEEPEAHGTFSIDPVAPGEKPKSGLSFSAVEKIMDDSLRAKGSSLEEERAKMKERMKTLFNKPSK